MAYKVIILYQLYMPSYFLGTFTEYPYLINSIENDGFVFKFLLQMWRIFRNIYSTNIRKNENIVLFDRFSVTILTKI